jgi:hypothetical protein
VFGKVVERVGSDGSTAVVQISDEALISSVAFWLDSFAPIQTLCVKQFLESHPSEFAEGWAMFLEWCDAADEFLAALRDISVEGD